MAFGKHLAYLVIPTLLVSTAGIAHAAAPPTDLDVLVATYREYGLPVPPPNALLVRFASGYRSLGGGKEKPIFHLGFLLKPAANDRPAVLLVGTEEYQPTGSYESFEQISPQTVKADAVEPDL